MAGTKKKDSIFLYDETVRRHYPVIAGIDEAGRGPLAGPVVAAAVILPPNFVLQGLRDSKMLSERERLRLFWSLARSGSDIGIGIVEARTIDETNILSSTKTAMKLAVHDLRRVPDIVLIDAVDLSDLGIKQKSIIRGESVSASIAAASVIAKTVRDDIMCAYHNAYPQYNFKGHKGYSTKEHMESIRLHGPCPIHRKSFRKVMELELPLKTEQTE